MADKHGIGKGIIPVLRRTYTDDYAGWVEDAARSIEDGHFSEIHCAALADDEVRDMGLSERELTSALRILLIHMLKMKYQAEKQSRSWEATIRVQRKHVGKFLQRSPSLRPSLPELLDDAYDYARIDAAHETGINIDSFPESSQQTVAEVLGE